MAAHQYWRLNFTGFGNSTTAIDIVECQMRTVKGGATVTTGGTASASNSGGASTPDKAFDGSTSTSWQTGAFPSLPQWLKYAFASAVDIVQITVSCSAGAWTYAPSAFDIQWSDDNSAWTTAYSVTGIVWPSSAATTYTINLDGTGSNARVSAQSIEVLSGVSPASVRVTSQAIEALVATYEVRVPKVLGYAVLSSTGDSKIAVSKSVGYAVLDSNYVYGSALHHRYWRLLFSEGNDASYIEVGELEMRVTPGGDDITGAGTASSSSNYTGFTPDKAFDNSQSGGWSTNTGATLNGSWLKYDFGGPVRIQQIALSTRTSGPSYAPKAWTVQYSDDNSAWTTAWSVTGQTNWRDTQVRIFTDPATAPGGGAHYHWRLSFTALQGAASYYQFAEIQLRTTAGGADQTGSGLGFANTSSNYDATLIASKLFDDNAATDWSVATGLTSGAYAEYVFNTAKAIVQIAVQASATYPQYAPGGFDFQYSDDGVSWTTAFSVTSQSGWTAGEIRTFPSTTTRRRPVIMAIG